MKAESWGDSSVMFSHPAFERFAQKWNLVVSDVSACLARDDEVAAYRDITRRSVSTPETSGNKFGINRRLAFLSQ